MSEALQGLLELSQSFFGNEITQAIGSFLTYMVVIIGSKMILNLNPKTKNTSNTINQMLGIVDGVKSTITKQDGSLKNMEELEKEIDVKLDKLSQGMNSIGKMVWTFTNATKVDIKDKLEVGEAYDELQACLSEINIEDKKTKAKEIVVNRIDESKKEATKKINSYASALKQLSDKEGETDGTDKA